MKRWPLIAVLVLSSTAFADNASDALALLEQGVTRFQAGRLDAACDALERARDLVPDKPNPHRWLGLVYARMGKCSQAVVELESFIKRVPPIDPRAVEAVTLRDRCKAELKPRFGALLVESTPSQARVRLDDAAAPVVGTTPYRTEALSVGSHLVVVEKAGFQTAQKGVAVVADGTARVDLRLTPDAAAAAPIVTVSATESSRRKPRYWVYGVVAGAVVVVALGVGLGVGLGSSSSGPPTLPPVRGGM